MMDYYLRISNTTIYISDIKFEGNVVTEVGYCDVSKKVDISEETAKKEGFHLKPYKFDKFFDLTYFDEMAGAKFEWCTTDALSGEYISVQDHVEAFFNKPSVKLKRILYKLFKH